MRIQMKQRRVCVLMMSVLATLSLGAMKVDFGSDTRANFPIPLPLRSISGQTVSADSGEPVPGVHVALTHGDLSQSQQSDGDGLFQFSALAPGTYVIQADGGDPIRVGVGGFELFITLEVP